MVLIPIPLSPTAHPLQGVPLPMAIPTAPDRRHQTGAPKSRYEATALRIESVQNLLICMTVYNAEGQMGHVRMNTVQRVEKRQTSVQAKESLP